MSRKIIAAIFAHPDDESMGPGATLAKLSKKNEVYLICATKGEKGGQTKNLGRTRYGELLQAARILGIKKVFGFDFPDGGLATGNYQDLVSVLSLKLQELKPEILITFEPRGLTGHLDHKTITMITNFLFDNLPSAQELWLYCMGSLQRSLMGDYFVPVPNGYDPSRVDKIEDVSKFWELKKKAISCHRTQKSDVQRVLGEMEQIPKQEYFLLRSK